jgi:hypothetical protein
MTSVAPPPTSPPLSEVERAQKRRERRPWVGLAAGVALLVLGPVAGVGITAIRLVGAFREVEGAAVAPEDKAKVLAAGIDTSMNASAIGVGVSVVGAVVILVAAAVLISRRHETTQTPPV